MRESLSLYTTFGIGGAAANVITVRTAEDLIDLASGNLVIGGGSNLLVSDSGYAGTVVVNRYGDIVIDGELVVAGSGAFLSAVSIECLRSGLTGFEWASGIPGTVGGAVRMNAGAFGSCIADRLVFADVLCGGVVRRVSAKDLGFGYRTSALLPNDTVISATFSVKRCAVDEVVKRTSEVKNARRRTQPEGRSAGSVFKNPPGVSVGELIEKLGFKGYTVGGAKVSEKHANIIVNTGNATSRDVRSIIETIKTRLKSDCGLDVEEEIIFIGEFD